MTTTPVAKPSWLETEARVTACKYQPSRINTLTLGIPTDNNHFLITFTYYVHRKTYTDEFTSPTYLEQGMIFPLAFNPLAPEQNSKSASTPTTGTPLFTAGIAASVILSLVWLALMRGCN
jgi:hypothetical protein